MKNVSLLFLLGLISWNIVSQSSPMEVTAIVADENIAAIYGRANVPATSPPMINIGVAGHSESGNGMGVRGSGNTGVRGNGAWGVIGNGSFRAGYFTGDLEYTGMLHGPSDQKLKTILKSDESSLSKLLLLSPKKYIYKTEKFKSMRLSDREQYGFLAQELEKVFPNLVKKSIHPKQYNLEGEVISERIEYKSVSLTGLIPHLTKGIQELAQENESYQNRVQQLEKEVSEMKLMMAKMLEK